MAHRPLKPCAQPGCPMLTRERLCPQHTIVARSLRIDRRPSAARRGYDSEWRAIRLQVLAEEPICRDCDRPSAEVDHIIPLRSGGTHARSNLQALCIPCHRAKTAQSRTANAKAATRGGAVKISVTDGFPRQIGRAHV